MHSLSKNRRGQGQTEYILLIGLLSIAILGGLLVYREAVKDFICRVGAALGGNLGDCGSASAPNPPPPPNPAPAPAPQNPPTAPQEWTNFFSGSWCGPPGTGWTWIVTPMGPTRVVTRANNFPQTTFNVEAAGPDRFRLTNAANPAETVVYERLSDNSFQLVSPLGRGYREGVYTRC